MTDQHPGFDATLPRETSPKATSNEALQQRIAAALYERERPPRDPHWPDAYPADREVFEPMAAAVLDELKPELDRLAEYENTINWMTTCTSCARVLDSSICETERAERAEAKVARVQALADEYPAGIDTALIHAALDEPTASPTATPATGPHTGLVVQPYRTDRGDRAWVFRCWGTSSCDGWLSLDHTSQQSAERARERHAAEAHTPQPPAGPTATRATDRPY
jgi:hypothetical protein